MPLALLLALRQEMSLTLLQEMPLALPLALRQQMSLALPSKKSL